MPHFIAILFFVSFTSVVLATPHQSKQERLINALITTTTVVYSDDGAADATVTERPNKVVRQIINLKAAAIPLLIKHLDDRRLTTAQFKNRRVPLGHICLDILLNITKGNTVHIKDCFDDGLGACIEFEYYFRPDVLQHRKMKAVQQAWARAFQNKKIKFQYPAWVK